MKQKLKFNRRRILLSLFAISCATVVVISIIMLTSTTSDYIEGAQAYDELIQYITDPPADRDTIPPDPKPDAWPTVDFDALRAINPDIVAWLICKDTRINYPVVQGSDNDYYLKHLFDGKQNSAGCLFVDSNNEPGFVNHNTVIYGHHMKDKSMFSTLTEYKTQAFYEKHPQMILLTPEDNYSIDLFAGYVTNIKSDSWKLRFASNSEFEEWIREKRLKSTFTSDIEVSTSDRFVTLSTCSYEFDNARYVVVGKLVPVD